MKKSFIQFCFFLGIPIWSFSGNNPDQKLIDQNFKLPTKTTAFTENKGRTLTAKSIANLYWSTYYGGDSVDNANSVVVDYNNDIIIGGVTSSPEGIATEGGFLVTLSLPSDGYLVKFDKEGQRIWGTYLGGIKPNDIAVNSLNELVVVSDSAIAKFTQAGMPVWSIQRSGFGRAVAFDNDGNILALGDSLIKLSPVGNQIWVNDYAGTSLLNDVGCDGLGNIYIAGHTTDTAGIATSGTYQSQYGGNSNAWQGHGVGWYQYGPSNGDGFIMKLDQDGTILWGTYYGGEKFDQITSLAVHPDGDLVVSGLTNSINNISSPGSFQPYLSINSFIIFSQFGIGFGDTLNPDCFFVGDTCVQKWFTPPYSYHYQDRDAFVASFTREGQRKWGTYFGSSGSDNTSKVVIDRNKNVYHSALNLYVDNRVLDSVWWDTSYIPPRWVSSYHDVGYGLLNTPYSYFIMGLSEQFFIYTSKFDSIGSRLFTSYYNGIPDLNGSQGQTVNQVFLGSIAIDSSSTIYLTGMTNAQAGIATSGAFKTIMNSSADHDAFLCSIKTSSFKIDTIYGPGHSDPCIGDTAVFTTGIITSPTTDMDFQWYKNNQPLPGATDSVLIIPGSSLIDTGEYHCIISKNDVTWYETKSAQLSVRDHTTFNEFNHGGQTLQLQDGKLLVDMDQNNCFDIIREDYVTYNDSLLFNRSTSLPSLYSNVSAVDVFNLNKPYLFTHYPSITNGHLSKIIYPSTDSTFVYENDLLNWISVWADFDNDGMQEGFKAVDNGWGYSDLFLVKIKPDTIFQQYAGQGPWNLWASCDQRAEVADYDHDGDIDILFVGTNADCGWNRSTSILVNDGGVFLVIQPPFLQHDHDGYAKWFDSDGDGDLDILYRHKDYIEEWSTYIRVLSVYSNNEGDYVLSYSDTVQSDQQVQTSPLIFDFNNDGQLDIVSQNILYEKNDSTYLTVPSTTSIAKTGLTEDAISIGDIDNDGDVDILGSNKLYINDVCNPPNTPPTPSFGLTSTVSKDTVFFFWQRATDLETPQMGLTYNLRVGTTPEGNDIMSSMSNESGWRKVVGMGNVYQNTGWWLHNLQPGTYYWSVQAIDNSFAGGPFAPEQTFEILTATHNISIPEGWSGLSSWAIPHNDAVESVCLPIQNQLTVLQTMDAFYFPSQNINTIGNWENQSAFKIKVTDDCLLNITGIQDQNKNLALTSGWNLMPVICNLPVDVEQMFSVVSNDIKIAKDVAGSGVYWPEYGINSIGSLLPGKAYFVNMNNAGTITFPQNDFSGFKTSESQKEKVEPSPWGWVYKTPSSHIFGIPASLADQFSDKSFVGAFTAEGICAGACSINKGQNIVLVANLDDPLTPEKEGFIDGESLSFKIWDSKEGKDYLLLVEFDLNQPDHSGVFAANGISAIKKMEMLTNIQEQTLNSIGIFPNPTSDKLNISGIRPGTKIQASMISSAGITLFTSILNTDGQIDVSQLSNGIYFLKMEDGNSVRFEKVVKK